MISPSYPFADTISAWQKVYGRNSLPWQNTSPYATWISEIMLQQTQVETVIPYYIKFMQQFPSVESLAYADINDVLAFMVRSWLLSTCTIYT